MYSVGWFSSGRGEGSRALLTAMQESIRRGEVRAKIEFVFCNREPGHSEETDRFLELVRSRAIPLVCFSSHGFRNKLVERKSPEAVRDWRLEYDREVMRRLREFQPDICVLAGYMLIVGPEMCRRYTMINLHPAAPGGPEGTWREVIWKLIEQGAEETGVMMHLVTPELDKGPPVTYCTFRITGGDFDRIREDARGLSMDEIKAQRDDNPLFRAIRREGMKRELPLIIATVKAFSEGRVRIQDGRVTDDAGRTIEAYSLTREIDRTLPA
ncbi:MAG: phosphoglycerate transporter [Dehalococcoidia bacterium]|nr:phosphoglycerate transporter [Dehalococcoidia bacterium]